MARLTPAVQGEVLTWYVDTHEQQLAVGTPAWYSWLQEASLFAFVGESGSFTARKETKPQGAPYWRAYRKRGGRLYHTYLGKSEQLTLEHLNAIAVLLARRGEGEETLSAQGFAQEMLPKSTPHEGHVVTRPASNLPVPLTSLIGREQERAAACTLLRRPEVRLATFTGTGGIGKTRLALQVATDLLADFADGVCVVSLASVSEPERVIAPIAQALGLWEVLDCPLLEQLQAVLRDRRREHSDYIPPRGTRRRSRAGRHRLGRDALVRRRAGAPMPDAGLAQWQRGASRRVRPKLRLAGSWLDACKHHVCFGDHVANRVHCSITSWQRLKISKESSAIASATLPKGRVRRSNGEVRARDACREPNPRAEDRQGVNPEQSLDTPRGPTRC